jgi:hypothetical protein
MYVGAYCGTYGKRRRATKEVESRTPKREPIVNVASRNNEQFVNVGAKKAWPLVDVVPEMDRRGKVEAVNCSTASLMSPRAPGRLYWLILTGHIRTPFSDVIEKT